MFIGSESLYLLHAYLEGFRAARIQSGLCDPFPAGFQMWCEGTYGISHAAWGWPRILHHAYGSEEAAIRAFPDVFARAVDELARIGDVVSWRNRRVRGRGVPQVTPTADPGDRVC